MSWLLAFSSWFLAFSLGGESCEAKDLLSRQLAILSGFEGPQIPPRSGFGITKARLSKMLGAKLRAKSLNVVTWWAKHSAERPSSPAALVSSLSFSRPAFSQARYHPRRSSSEAEVAPLTAS